MLIYSSPAECWSSLCCAGAQASKSEETSAARSEGFVVSSRFGEAQAEAICRCLQEESSRLKPWSLIFVPRNFQVALGDQSH